MSLLRCVKCGLRNFTSRVKITATITGSATVYLESDEDLGWETPYSDHDDEDKNICFDETRNDMAVINERYSVVHECDDDMDTSVSEFEETVTCDSCGTEVQSNYSNVSEYFADGQYSV